MSEPVLLTVISAMPTSFPTAQPPPLLLLRLFCVDYDLPLLPTPPTTTTMSMRTVPCQGQVPGSRQRWQDQAGCSQQEPNGSRGEEEKGLGVWVTCLHWRLCGPTRKDMWAIKHASERAATTRNLGTCFFAIAVREVVGWRQYKSRRGIGYCSRTLTTATPHLVMLTRLSLRTACACVCF